MAFFVNDVKYISDTKGTLDFTIPANAVSGYQVPSAAEGFVPGAVYAYSARSATGLFESGIGINNGSVQQRTTINDGSSGPGVKVDFLTFPTVVITALAAQIANLTEENSFGSNGAVYPIVDIGGGGSIMQVQNGTLTDWNISLVNYGGESCGLVQAVTRGATPAIQSTLLLGDYIGEFDFYGSDGTDYRRAAILRALIDDIAPSAGSMPTRFSFHTSKNGTFVPTERFRIGNSGLIATNNPNASGASQSLGWVPSDGVAAGFTVVNDGNTYWGFGIASYGNNGNWAGLVQTKTRGVNPNTHVIVQTGDVVGDFAFEASNGVSYKEVADIFVAMDDTPSATSMPARIVLSTTPVGATAPTERMRIDNAGYITQGGFANPDEPFSHSMYAMVGPSHNLLYGLQQYAVGNDFGCLYQSFAKTRGTTPTQHVTVQNNDYIGGFDFWGSDGTDYQIIGCFTGFVDGVPSANDVPGRFEIWTTDTGPSHRPIAVFDRKGYFALRDCTGPVPIVANPVASAAARFTVMDDNSTVNTTANIAFGNTNNGNASLWYKTRGATPAANTIVQDGDILGFLGFQGNDGVTGQGAAYIDVEVDGTPGVNSMPGRIVFATAGTSGFPTEALRITSAKVISVGGAPVNTVYDFVPNMELNGDSYALAIQSWSNSATHSPNIFFTHARGGNTVGSYGAVSDNDWLGFIAFSGADGTNLEESAWIISEVDGTPASNSVPGNLRFGVTKAGDQFATERMQINSGGMIIYTPGSTTPATLGTNGTFTLTPTSNTNFRISFRGTDGTTRVANITLA